MHQLKESFQKTKKLFAKTLRNVKSHFFGGYQKLPQPTFLNPCSCSCNIRKDYHTDPYFIDCCSDWECDLEKTVKTKNCSIMVSKDSTLGNEDMLSNGGSNSMKLPKSSLKKNEEKGKEEKKEKSFHSRKREGECGKSMSEGRLALAQKMKELEMMDVGDIEHVLDVEEALHYYSLLKSPVYIDIVDNFFIDMYGEYSAPRATASINNSKRRLGSIRL